MVASDRIVFVAEDVDAEDIFMASGLFAAHVESGRDLGEQVEGLDLNDALRWARERAPVVLLRLVDSSYYSAGSTNPDPSEYEEWPEGRMVERRRPRGMEALDNTESDAPVPWDVRFTVDGLSTTQTLETALTDPRTRAVPAEHEDARITSARVFIDARTRGQAQRIADDMADRLLVPSVEREQQDSGVFSSHIQLYPVAPKSGTLFGW